MRVELKTRRLLRYIDVDCCAGENGGGYKRKLLADDERGWHCMPQVAQYGTVQSLAGPREGKRTLCRFDSERCRHVAHRCISGRKCRQIGGQAEALQPKDPGQAVLLGLRLRKDHFLTDETGLLARSTNRTASELFCADGS